MIQKTIKQQNILQITILLIFMFLCPIPLKTANGVDGNELFKITVIDVGKGDCILIQTGEHTVMIDTGYKNTAENVIQFLKDHNITTIDTMIISHFHKDHVGGAAALIKSGIPITKIYMPDYKGTRSVYEDMIAALETHPKIEVIRLTEARSFTLGGAEYDIFPSSIAFDGDNDNNVSMAAMVKTDAHSAFFAGDLEDEGIESLLNYVRKKNINIQCGILKLPHHGAQGANTTDLLNSVAPKAVIITDGDNKRAHGTLIDLLKEKQIPAHCSVDEGTITITGTEPSAYSFDKSNQTEVHTSGLWKYILPGDGSAAIAGYNGKAGKVTIPASVDGYPVHSIAGSAFYNNKTLTEVTIPTGVTSIGNAAFSWCLHLTKVNIPKTVTQIGQAAFMWCPELRSIYIPDSVTTIGMSAFERCTGLDTIRLSNKLTSISESMFERCISLTSLRIPENVTSIGENAFKRSGLKYINIPDNVTSIDEKAFILSAELERVKLPAGLDAIKKNTFEGCTGLTNITIPESVTSIKAQAFSGCKSLMDIWFTGTEEQWKKMELKKKWDEGTPSTKNIHFNSVDPDMPDAPDEPDDPDEGRCSGSSFFRMQTLPATGFSSRFPETLPSQPSGTEYKDSGLTLQIPSLDVSAEIVIIPFANEEYPVEWLESRVGLPEEFAVPGEGHCILTGHNHLNTTEPGPFAFLSKMEKNDRIIVLDEGQNSQFFSVCAVEKIAADDFDTLYEIINREKDSLTLLTCEDELPEGGYASRRVISAKPID